MVDEHPTEAACLLEQGATFRRRIGLKPVAAKGDPIFAGFKQGAFSLYFGDAPIYHFDLEGRWQRAFVDGTHYLKGLDAAVHAIERVREGPNLVLKRRVLTEGEAAAIDARIRSTALELTAGLDADRLERVEPVTPRAIPLTTPELREFMTRISSWDASAWLDHRARYSAAYRKLPFLPPECQNAVVLQAASGIETGAGAPTLSADRFARHTRDVAELWGLRLLQSRLLFLAGAHVLHLPVKEVAALLTAIGQTFPIEPRTRGRTIDPTDQEERPRFDGVHAFLDSFALARPDRDGWHELASRGLVRLSLGVESGDREVRNRYQKAWDDDDLRATVEGCKTAGLGVSVLTFVGAGGAERAAQHREQTVQLIDSLALGAGDFVFLLDEKEMESPAQNDERLKSLQGSAWSEQQAKLKEALAPLKKKGVKVLPYTVEKQWT
jgi:hypothetical protein